MTMHKTSVRETSNVIQINYFYKIQTFLSKISTYFFMIN